MKLNYIGNLQVFKAKCSEMACATLSRLEVRDYLTNSWVGTCPELMNSFSPRALPVLYSTPRLKYGSNMHYDGNKRKRRNFPST